METNSNLLQEVYNDDMLKKTKKSKDLNEIIEIANLRSVFPAKLIAFLYPRDISLQISSFFEPNMTAGKFSLFRVLI